MPKGVRLTPEELAAKEKKQGAKDLLKEFFGEQFPRAGFPKKGGVNVRTNRGKELLTQIEEARQEGLLDKDNVMARFLTNIQSGAFPPQMMEGLGFPADLSEEEKKERGNAMWRAYKEGGAEGLDKFFGDLGTGNWQPDDDYTPASDTLSGIDFEELERTPALLREQAETRQTLAPQDAARVVRAKYGFKEPPRYVDVESGEVDPYAATMVPGVTEPVGGTHVRAKKMDLTRSGKPVASEEPFEGSDSKFKPSFTYQDETEESKTASLNSLYLFRTREALKSYIQLKNINPNNYVVVSIPKHLRNNTYLKSVNFNISNPNFKYMMVSKSYVDFTMDGAKPVLKVKELKQNEDAKKRNNDHVQRSNPEYVKKYGRMKGAMKEMLASKYEDEEIPAEYENTTEYEQAKKETDTKEKSANLIEFTVTKSKESKSDKKVEKVMHEFKEGKLHSGSKKGPKVTSRDQAVAIALSEAGKSKKKKDDTKSIIEKLAESTLNPVAQDLAESGHEGVRTIIELTPSNKKKETTKSKESLSDACWEGYEAIGFKKKNGKKVPNCVPKSKD